MQLVSVSELCSIRRFLPVLIAAGLLYLLMIFTWSQNGFIWTKQLSLIFNSSTADGETLWIDTENPPVIRGNDSSSNGTIPDILLRVTGRINDRVRNSRTASLSSRNSSFNSNPPPLLLTHDLVNAVGLGNFMFMTAALIGLADTSGRKPFLSVKNNRHTSYFSTEFSLAKKFSSEEISLLATAPKVIDIPAAGIYSTDLPKRLRDPHQPIFALHGYLQSWKYFHAQRQQVRRQFTFTATVVQQAYQCIENAVTKSKNNATTVIGVHVRRGDIVQDSGFREYGHTVASDSYLLHVVGNLTVIYEPALVLVVSNDMPYCQRLLAGRENIQFMEGNSPAVDMALLSLMDHLVLTVGTFGWWGGYLSDAGDIYYYRNWPRKGTRLDAEYSNDDYFPANWKSFGD